MNLSLSKNIEHSREHPHVNIISCRVFYIRHKTGKLSKVTVL